MKQKLRSRVSAALLSLAVIIGLMPGTVFAAGMQSGTSTLTVNQSKVAFAGHEWWVIGDGTSGVYPQTGHITLLSAKNDFGTTAFRTRGSSPFTDSTYYYSDDGGGGGYYANNPNGLNGWKMPNEYAGSTLQQKMSAIAEELSEKEQAVISARDLTKADGITGQEISDQKMWALSESEWNTINDSAVKKSYGILWWLRTSFPYFGLEAYGDHPTDTSIHFMGVNADYVAARPALSLNLNSVLFTSDASETSGKSATTVGSALTGMGGTSGTVKFTMEDSSQMLTVNATASQSSQTGQTLSFTYSNATTGTNQYVSCVLTDTDGNVKYYGKLADSSSAASGSLSVPLTGVENGTYTLQIFSEEANEHLYTDFCSEPVTMTVTVSNGSGTVSDFGGTVLHEHNWSDTWSSDGGYHWHECTADGCPVTDNSQKEGYAAHTYDQQVVSDTYLASAANCTDPAKYYYSCACGAAGTETFTNGTATSHTAGTAWKSDGSGHWNECVNCGDKMNEAAHTFAWVIDKEATTTEKGSKHEECTVCGYEKAAVEIPATGTTGDPSEPSKPGETPSEPLKDNPDTDTSSPQTGDDSNIAFWMAMLIVAGAALTGTAIYSLRRKYSG